VTRTPVRHRRSSAGCDEPSWTSAVTSFTDGATVTSSVAGAKEMHPIGWVTIG
jgi:hypothetical protein